MREFLQEFYVSFIDPANLAGHISYMLLIASMLMRKMHLLRMVAVSAGTFSAFYYSSLGDWVSFFWEVIFTLVNLVQLLILFIENRRGRFTSEEQMFVDMCLQGLERAHARRLVKMGEWVRIPDESVLINEDTTPTHLYFIVDGAARVERQGRSIGLVGPGDFLGEMSYLTGKEATATVRAITPMRCLSFERDGLRQHLTRNPEVRHALEAGFNRNLVDKLTKTSTATGAQGAAGVVAAG